MKKIKTKISKSNRHYDWAIMPDSYFATALLINEQLLEHTNDFYTPIGNEIFKTLGFSSGHPNYELALPMIFNFKHGIELGIKYLGIIDYGEYQNLLSTHQNYKIAAPNILPGAVLFPLSSL